MLYPARLTSQSMLHKQFLAYGWICARPVSAIRVPAGKDNSETGPPGG